jgi:hypothetical protein
MVTLITVVVLVHVCGGYRVAADISQTPDGGSSGASTAWCASAPPIRTCSPNESFAEGVSINDGAGHCPDIIFANTIAAAVAEQLDIARISVQ